MELEGDFCTHQNPVVVVVNSNASKCNFCTKSGKKPKKVQARVFCPKLESSFSSIDPYTPSFTVLSIRQGILIRHNRQATTPSD